MRFSIAAVSAVAFGALGAMAAEITIAEAGGPRLGRQVREGDAAPARIHYRLGTSAEIATVIDNERGQRVRNLVAQVERPAGEHAEPWDLADGREPQYVPMAEEIEWFLEDQFVIRHDGARVWEQDGYHAYVGFSGGAPVRRILASRLPGGTHGNVNPRTAKSSPRRGALSRASRGQCGFALKPTPYLTSVGFLHVVDVQ